MGLPQNCNTGTLSDMDVAVHESMHGLMVEPVDRLGRWATRRRNIQDTAALTLTARDLIGIFDKLLAVALTTLTVEVRKREVAEDVDPTPPIELPEADRLTVLLEDARRLRATLVDGVAGERFVRALRARGRDVAPMFEARRAAVLDHLTELESLLVLFGAGNEEDAALGQHMIPAAPEDLPPGPSLPFDL